MYRTAGILPFINTGNGEGFTKIIHAFGNKKIPQRFIVGQYGVDAFLQCGTVIFYFAGTKPSCTKIFTVSAFGSNR